MKIKNSEHLTSAVWEEQYPEVLLPELAFAGRSNVGKSSMINMLLGRKGLARTSSSPGKTQVINFYDVDGLFRFVDLPGYGYARVSKDKKAGWGTMINTYLTHRPNLIDVILLVDIRHEPTEDDFMMYQWIKETGFRGIVFATKLDKIKNSELMAQTNLIRKTLMMTDDDLLFTVSSDDRRGKYKIWDFFNESFKSHGYPIVVERQQEENSYHTRLQAAHQKKAKASKR
jgi:GTP-binding protein